VTQKDYDINGHIFWLDVGAKFGRKNVAVKYYQSSWLQTS
jgi:hypothetical protein